MKKKLLIALGVIAVLAIVAVIFVGVFLGNIIKAGMETVGPKITQTTLKVDAVSVSLLGGSAGVSGLVLGNPTGYKSPQAISVAKASVSIVPGSLLSDKIVIHSIEMRAPEITFEGNPFGANNFSKIMENVNAAAGAAAQPATNAPAPAGSKAPAKKLQVDDFLITGAKVTAQINTGLLNKEISLTLPDIHLSNLGQGSDGITAAELAKQVLGKIDVATIEALTKAVNDLGKNLGGLGNDAGKAVGGNVDKLKKGLGGLLGK